MHRTDVRRPPGPKGRRLFGNTIDYDRDRVAFLRRCQRDYGDVFSFDDRTMVVFVPELAHELLTRTNEDFLTESAPLATSLDPEQAATDAQLWMVARRKGWQGLSRKVALAHTGRLREVFDQTLNELGGRPAKVLSVMKTFFGRATADFCLGPQAEGMLEVITENIDAIEPLAGSSQLFPAWLPSRRVRRFVRSRQRTLDAITERIHRRQAQGVVADKPRDLLDLLLSPSGAQLNELQVQRLLRGVMLASYGVPAAAMTWLVWALSVHPDLWQRVVAEANAWTHDEEPPVSALPQTEAVIKEVLRLWPPTWMLGRTARRDTELGDWRLRAGDQVMFSPYLLHRDPRWWDEPERLNPDRWLTAGFIPQRHTYLPFGGGPRVCVGTQLAVIQLALATFWLAREYQVVAPGAAACQPDFQGVLVPGGFTAQFRRSA